MPHARYRPGTAAGFVDRLLARGRYGFALDELVATSGLSSLAAGAQLRRLAPAVTTLYPRSNYYLMMPPEHRIIGAPPVTWWIDDYFRHLGEPYYLGLLSAAGHYGISHQAVQVVQVMTANARKAITIGRIRIVFIRKKTLAATPVTTAASGQAPFRVSTPEATILDLMRYPERAGGFSRVAQIIRDLSPQLKPAGFREALKAPVETTLIQRTGFLLDALGQNACSRLAAAALKHHRLHAIPLSSEAIPSDPLDETWAVYGRLPAKADA